MNSLPIAALLAVACVSPALAYTIEAQPTSSQELRYDHGQAMIVDHADGSVVRVLPHANGPHGRMIFTVLAFNSGATAFNLGYENVEVSDDKGKVRLFTLDEIQREAQKAANWQTFAVAMAAGAQAYSAAQPTTYNSYGSVYGSNGGYAHYSAYGTAYSPAMNSIAQSQIQSQAADNLHAIQANLDSYMGTISGRILQITTIDPATANGGAVFADRPKLTKGAALPVKVVVRLGGDVHEFSFAVKE